MAFSGLYPDLTRNQAEFEQHEVNTSQGFQQWRLSAIATAQNFAQFVLGWDPRVNSNKNVTEGAQFTHLKMLLKPTSSFLLVCLLRGAGGQAARCLASRSPQAALLGGATALCQMACNWR